MADPTGALQTQTAVDTINLPLSQVIDPVETSRVIVGGNMSSDMAVGYTRSGKIDYAEVYVTGRLFGDPAAP